MNSLYTFSWVYPPEFGEYCWSWPTRYKQTAHHQLVRCSLVTHTGHEQQASQETLNVHWNVTARHKSDVRIIQSFIFPGLNLHSFRRLKWGLLKHVRQPAVWYQPEGEWKSCQLFDHGGLLFFRTISSRPSSQIGRHLQKFSTAKIMVHTVQHLAHPRKMHRVIMYIRNSWAELSMQHVKSFRRVGGLTSYKVKWGLLSWLLPEHWKVRRYQLKTA